MGTDNPPEARECPRLVYWGHSCFQVTLPGGGSIVFDPHDGDTIGLPSPRARAELVLVSHDHHDHNAVEAVAGENTRIVSGDVGRAEYEVGGWRVLVESFKAPHDRERGRRRGWVRLYRVTLPGGIVLLHLGDLGTPRYEGLVEWARTPRPHVMMVPVGGFFTLEPYEAWELVERVRPSLAAPMHYWVKGSLLPLWKVWDFLLTSRTGRVEADDFFPLCGEVLGSEKTRVLVFRKWLY